MENRPLIDDAIKNALSNLYQAPDRHYHGLAHIEALLALAKEYAASLFDGEAVEAAIWLHDAVYDSRRSDNEEQSALLAAEMLLDRADPQRLERIAAMIRATATHTLPDFDDAENARDAALFLDMDLAILGAPAADFDAYEEAIRREYDWVDEAGWRKGRAAVLERFLARKHIFHTAAFRQRFAAQARSNVKRSLAGLQSRESRTGSRL